MKPRVVPIRCEPRWRAATPALTAIIQRLVELIETREQRKRRRRHLDAATFHVAVECIACNLLAISLAAPNRPLAVPLANAASRTVSIFGKRARNVIVAMKKLRLVTMVKGYPYRGPTTVKPTAKLRKLLTAGQVNWGALRVEDHIDVVVLKPRTAEVQDDDEAPASPRRPLNAVRIERWLGHIQDEMRAINEAILSAHIECKGSAVAHISERPGAAMASLVTSHHRTLRRIFNGTYEEGGRAFGGFWQTMPRPDRFKNIRISGEPVAIVDYGQLFLRLAYAEAGTTPPQGDLYDITGQDAAVPGWKLLRDGRKKLVNALFFRRSPLKQWPGATIADVARMRNSFPVGTKPLDAIRAIKEKHAAIAHLFECGHGLRFMRIESDLIMAVTLALHKRGVIALPIHDAAAVRRSDANVAAKIMRAEAKRLTGAEVPVEI